MIRLADFVVKYLEKKKIDKVFTVSGGGSIFLCDACINLKKFNTFLVIMNKLHLSLPKVMQD